MVGPARPSPIAFGRALCPWNSAGHRQAVPAVQTARGDAALLGLALRPAVQEMEELVARRALGHAPQRVDLIGQDHVGMGVEHAAEQARPALHVPDEEAERLHAGEPRGVGRRGAVGRARRRAPLTEPNALLRSSAAPGPRRVAARNAFEFVNDRRTLIAAAPPSDADAPRIAPRTARPAPAR